MFQKVLEYAGPYRRTVWASVAVMLVGVALSVAPYLFLYQMLEPVLLGKPLGGGYTALRVGAIALCAVLYAVCYVEGLRLSHRAAYHTLENLRISLQEKLERQPLGVVQEQGVGAVKKMFLDDIESIELLLAHALPEGLANVAVPLTVYLAMFFVDWQLALLSLGSLPLGLVAMAAMYRTGVRQMGRYYAAAQKMNNTIVEYINGMEVVKVFNRDGESYRRFEQDVREYRDFTLAWYRVCWPWMALYHTVLPCVALVTLPVGAYWVLTGLSTLPDFALVLCMGFAVGAPLLRALGFLSSLPQVHYKVTALEQRMAAPPLRQTDAPFRGAGTDVDFDDVHFSYGEEEVLHGVTIHVPQGSLVALVGESGSGKSTLAKLLVHYYDVTAGAVRVGGQDVREMRLEALNRQISYVAQEQYLFRTTLQENIRLGRPDATDQAVWEAALRAQCGPFLARLEKGIHTDAGDGGKELSGGERQRISLARALLKDAPIVVLDEATAFLDAENEERMNAAIAQVIRGKTVVVIAHRLQSIVGADRIFVLEAGRLADAGTHGELLARCPVYRKLWQASEESARWMLAGGTGGDAL